MKITKQNLFLLIENLLLEESNLYQDLINEIIESKAITKGLIKAYNFIISGKYNPIFLRKMSVKERESFLDNLILELKKIVDTKEKIKFSLSEGKTTAYAQLGTFEKNGKIEFEIVLFIDNISAKQIFGDKLAKFIEDKVFHEFMHVENHFANLVFDFQDTTSNIIISLDQLDEPFYKRRYNIFQRRDLEQFYNDELNPNTSRGIDEMRVRIAQFEANNNLKEALEYSKNNKLSSIIKKYGDSDAPWLFMLDYSKGVNKLLELMGDLVRLDKKDVQIFKA